MAATANDNFRELLAEYVPTDSRFYTNIAKVYDILQSVGQESRGHGVTFVVRKDDDISNLEEHLEDTVPYNGKPHNIYDTDITSVVDERREIDGAVLVDTDGQITHAGIGLPFYMPAYKKEYGIEANIGEFMGFNLQTEPPVGLRTRSALYASYEFGDNVAILTLGEGGEINLYYCGDRIYNSAGRVMHWEMAKKLPKTRDDVVSLPLYQKERTERDSNEDSCTELAS